MDTSSDPQRLNSPSSLHNSGSVGKVNLKGSSSKLNKNFKISPRLITDVFTPKKSDSPRLVPTGCKQLFLKTDWSAHDVVSEDFVKSFNKRIGDTNKYEHAECLIEKMRELGGLIPGSKVHIDLPSARIGLAILSDLDNQKLKIKALRCLQELLKIDPQTEESAEGLTRLMGGLLFQMNASLQQHQTLTVQIEFAKTYGAVAELLLRHYADKHINGVTAELKRQLSDSAKALKRLNRQEDPTLSYHIKFALEGFNRLKSDRQELVSLLRGLFTLSLAAAAAYFEDGDALASELRTLVKNVRIDTKHAWYDMTILLHRIAEGAIHDEKILVQLLNGIERNQSLGWNFVYESIQVLTYITLHGKTLQIRERAASGANSLKKLPGVYSFAEFNKFYRGVDFGPIMHLSLPKIENTNLFIRITALKSLMLIAYDSPDENIRRFARNELIKRQNAEKSKVVQLQFSEFMNYEKLMPSTSTEQQEWINEQGKYAPKNALPQIPNQKATTPSKKEKFKNAPSINNSSEILEKDDVLVPTASTLNKTAEKTAQTLAQSSQHQLLRNLKKSDSAEKLVSANLKKLP